MPENNPIKAHGTSAPFNINPSFSLTAHLSFSESALIVL
jgi:hypothetical protein